MRDASNAREPNHELNAVEAYYQQLPKQRAERLRAIHQKIVEQFPDVTVTMDYRMPTFKRGDRWLAIASQKNYISVYTCKRELIEDYCQKHPEIKSGKGCLNIRDRQEVHQEDLAGVIARTLGE